MTQSSKLLEDAVNALARLPGIGRKTALRLALFLLTEDKSEVETFTKAILKMREEIRYCKECFNISDTDICQICASPRRIKTQVCIVMDARDVMAIENTSQFNGVYHVLGGIISPIDGIGPHDLTIDNLVMKVTAQPIEEVILALPTTIEGDTTSFYIYKRLKDYTVKISTIARGIAVGDELEYADEVTLGRSIINRTPYISTLSK
jgi:recombination protein RecR